MKAAVERSITEGVDYDIEYRAVWPDGSVHWVEVRGQPVHAADGTPLGIAGVSLDITERKLAEERQALLSREVDHRAKNLLAVVLSMLRLTRATEVTAYVRTVEARIAALARAQEFLAEGRWAGADFRAVVSGELAPFLVEGTRVVLDGPEVWLPTQATQPLTMALHELATNAVKYGALSAANGRLSVSWRVERERTGAARLLICWTERGGPPIETPPARRGFGGRVLNGTVRAQLGGAVSHSWERAGLACRIEVPLRAETAPVFGQLLEDA
jgi:two-component sensor histidine kinase